MNKQDLLKCILDMAYNTGFGAKKHFATFDIYCFVPAFISSISMFFGIFSLTSEVFSAKFLSATILCLGIIGISVSKSSIQINEYNEVGKKILGIYYDLKSLHYTVLNSTDADIDSYEKEYKKLTQEYQESAISKQLLLSNWYAHVKFFSEHEIEWFKESGKKFSFFRDKLPLSFRCTVGFIILFLIGGILIPFLIPEIKSFYQSMICN